MSAQDMIDQIIININAIVDARGSEKCLIFPVEPPYPRRLTKAADCGIISERNHTPSKEDKP